MPHSSNSCYHPARKILDEKEAELTALRVALAEKDKRLGAAAEKLINLVEDHYWDSLEKDRELIIEHFSEGIMPLFQALLDPTNPTNNPAERLLRSLWSDCLWAARHCEDCLEEQPCGIKIDVEAFLAGEG